MAGSVFPDGYDSDDFLGRENLGVEAESGLGGLKVGVAPHVVGDPRVELGEVGGDEVGATQPELR